MLHEVKIYDGNGKLVKTISPMELEEKSAGYLNSVLTERNRESIMSLAENIMCTKVNPQGLKPHLLRKL